MQPCQLRYFSFRIFMLGAMLGTVTAASSPALAGITFAVDLVPHGYGSLDQDDTTACSGSGLLACGPTAATNALVFLENKYGSVYGDFLIMDPDGFPHAYTDLVATANALGAPAYMDCASCTSGTLITKFISGQKGWIDDRLDMAGMSVDPTIYDDDENPNWDYMFDELSKMAAVELLVGFFDTDTTRVGGHYLTLNKFDWTDTNMDGIVNPGEGGEIGFVDPTDGTQKAAEIHQFAVGGQMFADYLLGTPVGSSFISFTEIEWAVSAVPFIPEPASILLLGLGIVVLVGRLRSL